MLREACSEKDSNPENQTEESTDNQLNVYAEGADQTPREKRRGGRENETGTERRTGAVGLSFSF